VAAEAPKDDDEEWEGFDDVEETTIKLGENEAKGPKAKGKQAKVEKTAKKQGPTKTKPSTEAVPREDTELRAGGFEALEEIEQEEDGADVSAWVSLGLSPQILSCLARLGFSKPTAIQSAAIPEIVAGHHDVIGKAATGSGKTLAFAIPIVQRWLDRDQSESSEKPGPMALVMSPTRELAHQITNHIKDLCASLPSSPYVCSVTGGLSIYKQQRQLEAADIVVGTPGRLWEVLSSNKALLESFRGIEFLVVDEADRLLTEGHFKEAEEILEALDREELDEDEEGRAPSPRQTLVFSATFNKGLQQKLAGKGRYDLMSQAQSMEYLLAKLNFREERPKFLDVNPVSQMAEGLKEGLVECDAMEKVGSGT